MFLSGVPEGKINTKGQGSDRNAWRIWEKKMAAARGKFFVEEVDRFGESHSVQDPIPLSLLTASARVSLAS